ncbi:7645_t:CDS:1, partial [Acaulospora morrowiae]
NTFFTRSHLQCSDAMLIGYYWLCGATYTVILNATGCATRTISNYMKYFRELVIETLDEDDLMIGGNGIIVEIDESKFCRGKETDGIWIVGGIERMEKRKCFFVIVDQRDAGTIRDIVSKHVKPGSIVATDCWQGY